MLEPIPNAVEKFIAQDDEPVVMLNLLRFLDGGRDLYGRYLHAVQASLAKVSAEISTPARASQPLSPNPIRGGMRSWSCVTRAGLHSFVWRATPAT